MGFCRHAILHLAVSKSFQDVFLLGYDTMSYALLVTVDALSYPIRLIFINAVRTSGLTFSVLWFWQNSMWIFFNRSLLNVGDGNCVIYVFTYMYTSLLKFVHHHNTYAVALVMLLFRLIQSWYFLLWGQRWRNSWTLSHMDKPTILLCYSILLKYSNRSSFILWRT